MNLLDLQIQSRGEHLAHFEPYDRQKDVIEATGVCPVTAMTSCNGAGKTALAAAIMSWHLTGNYPQWYLDLGGRVIDECGEYWALAPSSTLLKNALQEQLFRSGTYEEIYTDYQDGSVGWHDTHRHRGGKLAKRFILSMEKAAHYTAKEAYVSTIKVQHVSGGVNTLKFYHYELGVKKLAGKHNVLFWLCDEIPPEPILTELKARQGTNKLGILGLIAATPERYADQETIAEIFSDSWIDKGNGRIVVDIMDVPLRVMPTRQQKIDDCSPKNAPAKLHGLPTGGAVFFELPPEKFTISHSEWLNMRRQCSWTRINGLDFGFNDATAVAQLWTDIVSGVTVMVKSFSKTEMSPPEFTMAARKGGIEVHNPTAWPHDGERRDKDMSTTKIGRESKKTVAQFYKDAGFNMLPTKTKRFLLEANKHDLFEAIETEAKSGLFFVVAGNGQFNEEWRGLTLNEKGKVQGKDHILDAMACAWQNKQFGARVASDTIKSNPLLHSNNKSASMGISSHLLR